MKNFMQNDGKFILVISIFLILVVVSLFIHEKYFNIITEELFVYYEEKSNNGATFLDEMNNTYFINFQSLEKVGIKDIELQQVVYIGINKDGEILQVRKVFK